MSVTDWSPQPGGNALADRAIPARDGLSGREIPQAIRGLMASVSAFVLDQNGSLTTGGSANAYTLLTHSGITDLKPGLSVSFLADRDNTDVPTLNVDGLGPKPFLTPSGLPLAPSAIKRGLNYTVVWTDAIDALPAGWRLKGAAAVLNGNDFSALGDTAVYDRDHVALASEVQIGFRALTAPRLVTLPDVDAFPLGQDLVVADQSGACSEARTITIRAGFATGDTISGASQVVLNSPYQTIRLRRASTGVWSIQADRLAGLDDASKAVTRRNLGLGRFAFSVTRTQIATSPLSALTDRFAIGGWSSFGDGGCGEYVRDPSNGSGPMATQDSLGAWWMLDIFAGIMPLGAFGQIGTDDDTATVNRAIALMAPYPFLADAGGMNRAGRSGALLLPRRPIFCKGQILLSPNIRIIGQSLPNDWTALSAVQLKELSKDDWAKVGSALVYTGNGGDFYFIDSAPYNAQGQRVTNVILNADNIHLGGFRPVDGVQLEQVVVLGNYKCKGINLAGCNDIFISNPYIYGFPVGMRLSAVYNGTILRPRIYSNWRAFISATTVTALTVVDAKFRGTIEAEYPDISAPIYTGGDASLPAVDAWWTAEKNSWCCGVYSFYSNITWVSPTIENFDCAWISHNTKNTATAIYVEKINMRNRPSCSVTVERGWDQQHSIYEYKTITNNYKAGMLLLKDALVEVKYLNDNYSEIANSLPYNRLITDIEVSNERFLPRVEGLPFTPNDTYGPNNVVRMDCRRRSGSWTPVLKFGSASAGTQTGSGTWTMRGDEVTVTGQLTVTNKSNATGVPNIDGLPFVIAAGADCEFHNVIGFFDGANLASPAIRGVHGAYSLNFASGLTHTAFPTTYVILKFSLTYRTTDAQYL
ncbi:hypothetical protein [Methylorubrum aminovorans]|uniref:hypothetical protein n=1 Tax=Methylorubrum aminovorans TaxID=269069 RepID=UPI003C2F515B